MDTGIIPANIKLVAIPISTNKTTSLQGDWPRLIYLKRKTGAIQVAMGIIQFPFEIRNSKIPIDNNMKSECLPGWLLNIFLNILCVSRIFIIRIILFCLNINPQQSLRENPSIKIRISNEQDSTQFFLIKRIFVFCIKSICMILLYIMIRIRSYYRD